MQTAYIYDHVTCCAQFTGKERDSESRLHRRSGPGAPTLRKPRRVGHPHSLDDRKGKRGPPATHIRLTTERESVGHPPTGVPKTLASTWLGRVSLALIVADASSGFYKEGKEILNCQAGN